MPDSVRLVEREGSLIAAVGLAVGRGGGLGWWWWWMRWSGVDGKPHAEVMRRIRRFESER